MFPIPPQIRGDHCTLSCYYLPKLLQLRVCFSLLKKSLKFFLIFKKATRMFFTLTVLSLSSVHNTVSLGLQKYFQE